MKGTKSQLPRSQSLALNGLLSFKFFHSSILCRSRENL